MKLALFFTTLSLALGLNANEFPLVVPISVERAPLRVVESVQTTQTLKEKKVDVKKVDAANQTNPDEFAKTRILDIDFEEGSASITEDSMQAIAEFAQYLKQNKGYQVVLYGYTYSEEKKHDNLVLSQKRVDRVVDVLIELGVSSTRLTAVGQGKAIFAADGVTENSDVTNSRVEALIIK